MPILLSSEKEFYYCHQWFPNLNKHKYLGNWKKDFATSKQPLCNIKININSIAKS